MDEAGDRSGDGSLWYRLGYTLEWARGRTDARLSPSLAGRRRAARGSRACPGTGAPPLGSGPWDLALRAALRALAKQALPRGRRSSPSALRLLGAGATGAAVAVAAEAVRTLVTGPPGEEPSGAGALDAALAGARRGLLYGSLVEPLLPAPPLVRGAAYGLIEHLATPLGGLAELLGPRAPRRALSLVSRVLDDSPGDDNTLAERLAFGIVLAALLGEATD